MIRSPVPRLPKDGWAQVKLIGTKVLGYTWDGVDLKDSYQLTGKAVVRVQTAHETYDYPLNLDVEVFEIPF